MQDVLINVDELGIERLNRVFKLQKDAFLKNPYPPTKKARSNNAPHLDWLCNKLLALGY